MISDIINKINQLTDESIQNRLVDFLAKLTQNTHLTPQETQTLFVIIMSGRCPDILLSAIITAWRIKGETTDEIASAALVMRHFAKSVVVQGEHLVDIVGTGGDGANLFNVSSAASFVAAQAGANVAKHGSTGVSSKSGASDLLAALGVNLQLSADELAQTLDSQNLCFLFAPNHHPAMKHAKTVRAMLKMRTIFNILGPLSNPANVPNTVLGVFEGSICEHLATVMGSLGSRHVWVVHSDDGLDEISLATNTTVAEYKDGKVNTFVLNPEDFGVQKRDLSGLSVASAEESLKMITQALSGENCDDMILKAQDMIALNAAAALYVSGVVDNYQAGVDLAKQAIVSGKVQQKMQDFAQFTQTFHQ